MQYKTGLVIGRFQPFHLGHKYLAEKALELCESIIIGIGSSNIKDKKNPYDVRKRKKFLQEFIKREGIEKRVLKLVEIPDDPDDDVWMMTVSKNVGSFDISIGDNDWVNGIFEKAGIPVVKIGFFNRDELEGTKIRGLIKDKKKWEKRVPSYLVSIIEST